MTSEAFKCSIIPLKGLITSHARKFLIGDQEVEDVTQETFLKLWEIRDKLELHPNLKGLSIEITKNLCRNRLKRKKRMESIDDLSLITVSVDLCSELEFRDELNEVLKIINSLPSLQKQVFRMKHIDGYEVEEIAEIIGSTKEAVRMHLSRARRKINEIFNNVKR